MTWEEAKAYVESLFPAAYPVMVTRIVQIRYRIFADDKYWGQSQKTIERAWLSAAEEMQAIKETL